MNAIGALNTIMEAYDADSRLASRANTSYDTSCNSNVTGVVYGYDAENHALLNGATSTYGGDAHPFVGSAPLRGQ